MAAGVEKHLPNTHTRARLNAREKGCVVCALLCCAVWSGLCMVQSRTDDDGRAAKKHKKNGTHSELPAADAAAMKIAIQTERESSIIACMGVAVDKVRRTQLR